MGNEKIFISDWNPLEYLQMYYHAIQPDELATIPWIVNILRREVKGRKRVLVYGIGPAIKDLIPVIPYATKIDIADYNGENLDEIRKWINQDASMFSWSSFVEFTLRSEGKECTLDKILEREQDIRHKIDNFIISDADHISEEMEEESTKVGLHAPYDLVFSLYCADSSTENKTTWRRRMRNISKLVAPRGLFITAALGNASYYEIGEKRFPSAKVSQDELEEILKLDFLPGSVRVEERSVKGHGYSSILLGHARKAA